MSCRQRCIRYVVPRAGHKTRKGNVSKEDETSLNTPGRLLASMDPLTMPSAVSLLDRGYSWVRFLIAPLRPEPCPSAYFITEGSSQTTGEQRRCFDCYIWLMTLGTQSRPLSWPVSVPVSEEEPGKHCRTSKDSGHPALRSAPGSLDPLETKAWRPTPWANICKTTISRTAGFQFPFA